MKIKILVNNFFFSKYVNASYYIVLYFDMLLSLQTKKVY